MAELRKMTISGKRATVAFLTEIGGQLVDPPDAKVAVAKFDDGSVRYYDAAGEPKALGDKPGHDFHGNQWTGAREFGHVGPGGTEPAMDSYNSWAAISDYMQNTHFQVNTHLRGMGGWKGYALQETKRMIGAMDNAFRDPHIYKVLKKDTPVYRGIDNERVWRSFAHMKKGSEFGDKAFVSTSFKEAIATHATDYEKSVLLRLELPRGMKYLTGRGDEREAILNRGITWRITDISKGPLIYATARPVK